MMRLFGRCIFLMWISTVTVFALGPDEQIKDFNLVGTDGRTRVFSSVMKEHDAAVVIFVATKCPYSNSYNGRYSDIFQLINVKKSRKIVFFAINSNSSESMEEIKEHARKNKFPFPVLKDERQVVADMFGAEKTPEAYLLSKKGVILYHGRIDDDTEGKNIKTRDLIRSVDEYFEAKPISVKETKSFGCSIKRN